VFLPNIRAKDARTVPLARVARYTREEIDRNWRVIRREHNLWFPILQLTLTQASLGVMLALAPALSVAVLHLPIQDSSHYLIIPAGVGMVLGVMSVGRLAKHYAKTRLIAVGLIVGSSALTMLGLSSWLHLGVSHLTAGAIVSIGLTVATLVLILGFMNALISAASQTLLQENTTDASRGKVFGALNMMVNIAATLPIFFAGILADLTSVNWVVGSLGLLLLLFAGWQYWWLRRTGKLLRQASTD
jgi:MFS family permease